MWYGTHTPLFYREVTPSTRTLNSDWLHLAIGDREYGDIQLLHGFVSEVLRLGITTFVLSSKMYEHSLFVGY
jgi:hypothetical protein